MKENILTKIKVNIDKDDTANQMLEDMLKVTLRFALAVMVIISIV